METNRVRTDRIRMSDIAEAERKPLKVILDSNVFFVPLQFKIDIFEELKALLNRNFEPVLISPVKREVEKIAKVNSPKMRRKAVYALKLVEKCRLIEVNDAGGSADDAIVKAAYELHAPVFTNDMQLKKRLRNINAPVIYVRQKSRLEIDGRL
jgi:rRNA-processing protein FCF1